MKIFLMAVLSVASFCGVCMADDSLNLKDGKVKMSYSIGYQVGSDFKRQGINISPEILLKGVQDALVSNESLITPQNMRTTLIDLQKTVQKKQEQKGKEGKPETERSKDLSGE